MYQVSFIIARKTFHFFKRICLVLLAVDISCVSPWRISNVSFPPARAHFHVVGMLRFMSDIKQPSLPTPFYSVLVSISVLVALSTVFHSVNSHDNSPFSRSVLPVLSLPYWSFQLYISLSKSPSALI